MSADPFVALHDLLSGDEDARACRDIEEAACREQPRNVGVHVTALALTRMGDGIADARLILSWLLSALGAPTAAVALLVPLREALVLLPQLAVAGWLRRRPVRKWFWVAGSAVQGVSLLGMAVVAWSRNGAAAGWMLLALVAVFSLARGVCSVAHKDVLGKTVARQRRGRVGGHASSIAGAAVLALGGLLLLVPADGRDTGFFTGLLVTGGVLWLAAAGVFATLAEHPGATGGGASALAEALASLSLIVRERQLALFLAARALLAGSALMAPFLVLLAREAGHRDLTSLGLLVLASGAAGTLSASAWGRWADRSSRRVMTIAGVLAGVSGLAAVALADAAIQGTLAALGFAMIWFVLAVAHTGIRLGRKTHLVDMAGADRRAAYVAVSNTLMGAVLLAGGLFGFLAHSAGTRVTVALLAALTLAGAACALALEEVQGEA